MSALYLLYQVFIPLLHLGFRIAAVWDPKVRRGREGREGLFEQLKKDIAALRGKGPRIWIHSSSMGEFEQAKPVVREIKRKIPESKVVVSFFSPSAFDHVRNYRDADVLCYIPFDSRKNAARFLSILRPDLAVMVRHDLWPNHLAELNSRSIPVILINCSARRQLGRSDFLTRGLYRFLFRPFDIILTVSEEAEKYCRNLGLPARVETVGDTRYDQVMWRAKEAETVVAPLRRLKGKRIGLVAGSTWPSDEEILFEVFRGLLDRGLSVWFVLVPHEPEAEHLLSIEKHLAALNLRSVRFSSVGSTSDPCDVLVVDRIGILASLYALGEVAFVGGGFGPGIHNVLEPAALGKTVLFGPRYKNSHEADRLLDSGVGSVVHSQEEMSRLLLSFFQDSRTLAELGRSAGALVQRNIGATERIVGMIVQTLRQS